MEASSNQRLVCHGAVYGKADGQSTGYRWLELTEQDFEGVDLDRLIALLSLGQESLEEGSYYAWRSLGSRYCAARASLSRAHDASGRSGIVEKAILIGDGSADLIPRAALSMFRALEPGNFGSRWWETRLSREWETRDYHLPGIDFKLVPGAQEDVDRVAGVLREHPNEWQKRLRPVVASGLASVRPAILELPPQSSIPDYGLIVALLEMLASTGDGAVSVAGWFPSVIGTADTLGHWDIIVAEEGRLKGTQPAIAPDAALVDDKLQRLFLSRPASRGTDVRAEFEKELRRFADPESMPNVSALQTSFPHLDPAEAELVTRVIADLEDAQLSTPDYLLALDQGSRYEFKLAMQRRVRLQCQVQRLQAYLQSAR